MITLHAKVFYRPGQVTLCHLPEGHRFIVMTDGGVRLSAIDEPGTHEVFVDADASDANQLPLAVIAVPEPLVGIWLIADPEDIRAAMESCRQAIRERHLKN